MVPYIMKIKQVITISNVVHLFHYSIISFKHIPKYTDAVVSSWTEFKNVILVKTIHK